MLSLARSNLRYEWRRYLAAVLAVTFAGLLVLIQLSLLLGMFRTVSVVIDRSDAQLWIGYRNTQSVDMGRALPPGSDVSAWMHPDVTRIEHYLTVYADLRRRDGVPVSIVINAIDTSPSALAFSKDVSPDLRADLDVPGAIFVDVADRHKLDADLGTVIEINGRRAFVAGFVNGLRAIGGVNVLCSFATARSLSPESRDETTFHLVQLRPGADTAVVAQEIQDKSPVPRYSVWTSGSFSIQSQDYWLRESGAGIGSGFAALLALVVGFVITSQTLSGAILASIREFAALRALGVSRASLRGVVMEQSFWIGLVGLGLTGLLTLAIAWIGKAFHIAMVFPWWMVLFVTLLILVIALVSGLFALRPLMRADPATLLR